MHKHKIYKLFYGEIGIGIDIMIMYCVWSVLLLIVNVAIITFGIVVFTLVVNINSFIGNYL